MKVTRKAEFKISDSKGRSLSLTEKEAEKLYDELHKHFRKPTLGVATVIEDEYWKEILCDKTGALE